VRPSEKLQVRRLSILIVIGVAFSVYLNTLPNGFVVDDLHQVVDNQWITSPSHLSEIFSSGVWDFEGRESSYYRPMMYVFYMVTYMIFGLKPWAFHLVNILLHAAVTGLVFLFVQRICAERIPADRWYLASPFVAAMLFAVHPIHTEAVAWVAGITDLSYSFFYLLGLTLYVRSGKDWDLFYVLSLLSYFLALLCKEPAMTFPVILFAYELVFSRGKSSWRILLIRLIPFCLTSLLYAGLRAWALGSLAPPVSSVALSPSAYALNVLVLFSRYMGKLVFPVNLNFWHVFKPIASLSTADAIFALLAAGIGAFIVFLVRSNRPCLFASVLTVVPLAPVFVFSRMNQGIENVFTERYLYLVSAGFVLLVAEGGDWCRRRIPFGTHIVAIVLAVLIVTLSIGTMQRNMVWQDSYSLWSDAARKSPESAIARMNHGYALLSQQKMNEGLVEIQEALRLKPTLLAEKNAKGVFYAQQGLTKKAILEFHFILAAKPDYAPAHYNLGILYDNKGWIDQAIQEYEAAIKIQPDYAEAHNNLGIAHARKGFKAEAVKHLKEAVRLRPTDAEFAMNLDRVNHIP
jgi:tetratricopeptide (TPR) repeat protein